MSNEIINGALYMAKLGYHVFPLIKKLQKGQNSRGTPKGWNHNAPDDKRSIPSVTDLDEIKAWTKHGELVGYGVNPRDRRAVVLDVDIKDGKVGAESLKALLRDFGLSLNTFCVRTQSGGLHLYYSYDSIPEGFYVKGTCIEGYPDIDLRADASFVNGPYKGGKYKIVKDLPTATLPSKLIEQLPLQPLVTDYKLHIQFDDAEALSYGDSLLKGTIPEIIHKGERDNTLIRLIGSWARKFPIDTTIILTKEALSRCEGKEMKIEDYIPKIETTYEKVNFKPIAPEMLEWMEDHLILIAERKSVYDLSKKAHSALVMKEAAQDIFRNWIYYIEDEKSGRKHKIYAFTSWMESPKRQSLKSYGYFPKNVRQFYCDIQDAEVANIYSPPFMDYKPKKDADHQRYIDKFLLFCEEMFGTESEFMLDWVAHQIQKPDVKLTIAPVLISEIRGVGKNLFFDIVKNMVGKWNTTEADVTEAVDKFCEFATKHHLVLINEANVDVRDKRGMNMRRELLERLKSKITENMQTLEPKYIGRFNARSFINYLVAGNTMDAIPVEEGDRRFHVIQINAVRRKRAYYDDLWALARSPTEDADSTERAFALRQFFVEREITLLFRGDAAKMSNAKQEMIDSNKSSEQIEIDEAIMNYYSIFRSNIITRELFYWYVQRKLPGGHRLSQGAVRDLFRGNFKAIAAGSRAKQMLVKLPEQEVNGSILAEESKKCALYTIRKHGTYNKTDTKWLKADYNRALETTEFTYKEPIEEDEEAETLTN